MLKYNPQTGQMEDDGQAAPDITGAPPPLPISVRPQPAPIQIIPPGEEPPPALAVPTPGAAPTPIAEPPPMVKSESKTTTTREVPTKAEGGLMNKIGGEFGQQATLTRKEGEINQREAASAATGAEAQAAASGERQGAIDKTIADQSALVKAAQDKVTADRAKYDAEVTRLGQMDVKGFYEGDEGRGRAIAGTIAVALGEIGRILLKNRGGPNAAIQAIHDQEDLYYKDQKAQIDKQKDVISAARDRVSSSQGGLNDVRQGKLDQLADLNLQFAARSQAIADKFKAEGARIGTEHALVTADKMATAEEQRRDMFMEGYQQNIRQKVATETQTSTGSGAGGGRGSADQAKAAGFAERMQHQLATLKGLPPLSNEDRDTILRDMTNEELAAKHPEAKAFAQRTGLYKNLEEKLSPQGRAYYQAAREFISANLRRESGAAISQGEVHDALQRFLPVRGDTESDRARKNAAMDDVVHGAIREAGPAASTIAQTQTAPAAPSGDKALETMARERLAKNPNDAVARQWLSAHGLQ